MSRFWGLFRKNTRCLCMIYEDGLYLYFIIAETLRKRCISK